MLFVLQLRLMFSPDAFFWSFLMCAPCSNAPFLAINVPTATQSNQLQGFLLMTSILVNFFET